MFISGGEKELEIMASSLEELQERLDDVINTQTVEQEEIDRELEIRLQKIVELSGQLSSRNAELEKENEEKEAIATQLENCKGTISNSITKLLIVLSKNGLLSLNLALVIISVREKELEKINSSLKDQLKEIQVRLEDRADVQKQKSEQSTLEQADRSKQIVELQNQMISSNAAMQTLDIHEKKMAQILSNCKGTKSVLVPNNFITVCQIT